MVEGLIARTQDLEQAYPGLRFESGFEGAVPVQAWGRTPTGDRFYFRWRGRTAGLTVGPPARTQPPTAAELIARITGDAPDARTQSGHRSPEVYPEGPRVVEETPADDNLEDAPEVFHLLYLKHQLERRHQW